MPESKTVTCSLSSSSSGNSIMIRDGEATILIDAGMSAKTMVSLLASVNTDINSVAAIFITHEHIDHIKGLRVLSSKYKIPFYITWESFNRLDLLSRQTLAPMLNLIKPGMSIRIKNFEVIAYKTPHDSAQSVGFVISKHGRKIIGIATDIGKLTRGIVDSLCGCEIIYIESNHDLDMLHRSSYTAQLKSRIRSDLGHLSNDDCAKALPYLIANNTRKIMLYHLSSENNSVEVALETAKNSILGGKLNAGTIYLGAAPKSQPSVLLVCETDERAEELAFLPPEPTEKPESFTIDLAKVRDRIISKLQDEAEDTIDNT